MKRLATVLLATTVLVLGGARALAQTDDDPKTLAAHAVDNLKQGHPAEAIADFEALADRGVVDANMSFDRGLAYAERIRVGGEKPGDLGLAAHGFEEARALTTDPAVRDQATRALTILRAEVGRRRARAGNPIDLEPTPRLRDAIVGALAEDTWCILALFASFIVGAGLFVRWLTKLRRIEIAANVTIAIAAPLFLGASIGAFAARDIRLHRIEAVVVSSTARPCDAAGIALPNAEVLPEAARVQLMAENAGWSEVRWGALDAWLPSSALRTIDKPPAAP
ncbi:MAG: hypothetical protein ABI551_13275 [Polyangiaceae bacterium]